MNQSFVAKSGRVAVLGCGYVGGRVVRQALARGMRVSALTSNRVKADELAKQKGVDAVCSELESDDWHGEIDPVQDLVLNCVSSRSGGLEGYRRSYLEGQESINRWLAGGRARVLVYTGSIGVYPQDDGGRVDETAPVGGRSEYADLLVGAEKKVLEGPGTAERRYVLRLAGIYGPGRHYLLDRILAGDGALPGDREGIMNAIHVEDVCRAVWSVFDGARPGTDGVYNVVDDCPEERGRVAEWLAMRSGRETPRFDPDLSGPRSGKRGRRARKRRIANDKLKRTFEWSPLYPSYREGYEALLKRLA